MSGVALTQDGLLAGVINHTLYPGASSCVDCVVRKYIDITSYLA